MRGGPVPGRAVRAPPLQRPASGLPGQLPAEIEGKLLCEIPELSDITPLPQLETETPVVKILHSDSFDDALSYFRAIVQSGEVSMRALLITSYAAIVCPSHYSVWQYRRKLLAQLKVDPHREIEFVQAILLDNWKNYQLWYHRQQLVASIGGRSDERDITDSCFEHDAKNYHAWSHRQWFLRTYPPPSWLVEERAYCDRLLSEDVRNNSAWNQRMFVLLHTPRDHPEEFGQILTAELNYTLEKLNAAPSNESGWNYLRGLYTKFPGPWDAGFFATISASCDALLLRESQSPHLNAFMFHFYRDWAARQGDVSIMAPSVTIAKLLRDEIDTIRAKYWDMMHERVVAALAAAATTA
ncbi:hypothetical protein H696_05572 [Fonticula alba]|uniref:Protein farnesyltransferase/geranylgeranyltransferase type-1 subunit alpha n=1 Tax=Fonticula alba TaxID=691883 RepID=A0A058Z128_FONAL|nr:hypothetical protein H696_05572 [Fonticula alba]KCV67841.1 hypothetical protein H696_05572 [Fonticula alba]|eukprot:XP_009497661.1 hypothetical protein H696_05572 [Fonticula alba]